MLRKCKGYVTAAQLPYLDGDYWPIFSGNASKDWLQMHKAILISNCSCLVIGNFLCVE